MHQFFEYTPALLIILKLVKAGTSRRKQHNLAWNRLGESLAHRRAEVAGVD